MSWFTDVKGVFKRVFSFIQSVFARPGLDKYLKQYLPVAVNILKDLADTRSNEDFHAWRDAAWRELKRATGEVKGNWIAILIDLAWEHIKAEQEAR